MAIRYAVIHPYEPQHDHDLQVEAGDLLDTRPLPNHPEWVSARVPFACVRMHASGRFVSVHVYARVVFVYETDRQREG